MLFSSTTNQSPFGGSFSTTLIRLRSPVSQKKRAKSGLSLNVLAQKAGVSRQTVSYVEQEVQNPTLDTLLRITSVLEVDLEKIIAEARKMATKEKI